MQMKIQTNVITNSFKPIYIPIKTVYYQIKIKVSHYSIFLSIQF